MKTETNAAAQAGDEPMRAAFEAWARDPQRSGKLPLDRWTTNGGYKDSRTYIAFYGWCSALASKVSPRATADVERDAARHRWHRKPGNHFWLMGHARWNTPEQFDAAIDAAIATTKPGA